MMPGLPTFPKTRFSSYGADTSHGSHVSCSLFSLHSQSSMGDQSLLASRYTKSLRMPKQGLQ